MSCLLRLAVATLYLSLKKVFSATSPTTRNEIKAKRSGINQVSYYKRGDFVQESNKCRSAASYQKSPRFFSSHLLPLRFVKHLTRAGFCDRPYLLKNISVGFPFTPFCVQMCFQSLFMGKLKVAFLLRFLNDLCNIVRMLSAFIFSVQSRRSLCRVTFEAKSFFSSNLRPLSDIA